MNRKKLIIEYKNDILSYLNMSREEFTSEVRLIVAISLFCRGKITLQYATDISKLKEEDFIGQVKSHIALLDNSIADQLDQIQSSKGEPHDTLDNTAFYKTRDLETPKSIGDQDENKLLYCFPDSKLLLAATAPKQLATDEHDEDLTRLNNACLKLKAPGIFKRATKGPFVTIFEFEPAPGTSINRLLKIREDLCLVVGTDYLKIDRIPGRSALGIEIPNKQRVIISLRDIVESPEFQQSSARLCVPLGKTVDGSLYLVDLAALPHVLIAGATGSGKSVLIHAILLSLLFRYSPAQLQFILVDPKSVELGFYSDLPNLLQPVVSDSSKAKSTMKWVIEEMESRYEYLSRFGVQNIEQYNQLVFEGGGHINSQIGRKADKILSYIVLVIDELADMMITSPKDVELCVVRLAQMGRAAGIHLILATQRPSSEIITSQIKANMPARIAFRVFSKLDSRTILDEGGAERLLGQGDMLFRGPSSSNLMRIHGACVNEDDIRRVCDYIRLNCPKPFYGKNTLMDPSEDKSKPLIVRNSE